MSPPTRLLCRPVSTEGWNTGPAPPFPFPTSEPLGQIARQRMTPSPSSSVPCRSSEHIRVMAGHVTILPRTHRCFCRMFVHAFSKPPPPIPSFQNGFRASRIWLKEGEADHSKPPVCAFPD